MHAGLIGFALGGGAGTVSTGMNKKNKTSFYEYLAPKSYKNDQAGLFYKLEEAQQDLENAPDNKKEKFQRRVDIITGGKKYSEAAKEEAKKDFKDAAGVVGDLFAVTDINYDSDIEFKLSKYFKIAEDIDNQNKNLWFKAKDLNYEYVDNQEKFNKLKKEYGRIRFFISNRYYSSKKWL